MAAVLVRYAIDIQYHFPDNARDRAGGEG